MCPWYTRGRRCSRLCSQDQPRDPAEQRQARGRALRSGVRSARRREALPEHPDQQGHPRKHRRVTPASGPGTTVARQRAKRPAVRRQRIEGSCIRGCRRPDLAVHETRDRSGQRRSCSRRLVGGAVGGGYTAGRQCWSGAHERPFLHDDVAEQVTSAGNTHIAESLVFMQLWPAGQSVDTRQAVWHRPEVHTSEPVQSL